MQPAPRKKQRIRSLELLDVVIRNNSPETKRNEKKDDASGGVGGNAKEWSVVWCGVVWCLCRCLSVFADQSDDQITGEETDE